MKTIRVMFVCLGNICRSPMAECVLKDMVAQRGLAHQFYINSSATSTEEIGNPIHPGTQRRLKQAGVPLVPHHAVQLRPSDYGKYDYFIGMDASNRRSMLRMLSGDPEGKVHLLLDFTDHPRDVADPWYTGNFDATYEDVVTGCESFLRAVLGE